VIEITAPITKGTKIPDNPSAMGAFFATFAKFQKGKFLANAFVNWHYWICGLVI
jgi:hypothetical protein